MRFPTSSRAQQATQDPVAKVILQRKCVEPLLKPVAKANSIKYPLVAR